MGIDSLSWKSKRNTDNVLYSYNIKKGYSYAANLTPNEFIDENPQGMNQLYISKLINNFDVVMNYSYSASKPLNLKYQYKIVSSIVGEYHNTPDGEKAEVWVKEFPVTNPVEKTVNNSNSFNIQEKFTVDFHYYDNYVKEFMRQIGVTIDAYLKLCQACFERYGKRVKYWLTFNELNVNKGYAQIGVHSTQPQIHYQAMHHIFVASAYAVKMAHEMMPGCMVGNMYAMSALYPLTCKPDDMLKQVEVRRLTYYYSDVMLKGKYPR